MRTKLDQKIGEPRVEIVRERSERLCRDFSSDPFQALARRARLKDCTRAHRVENRLESEEEALLNGVGTVSNLNTNATRPTIKHVTEPESR